MTGREKLHRANVVRNDPQGTAKGSKKIAVYSLPMGPTLQTQCAAFS